MPDCAQTWHITQLAVLLSATFPLKLDWDAVVVMEEPVADTTVVASGNA